jgi:hypothetical protein
MPLQRQQSRRRGCVRPAALPCPPYAPLSRAAVVGRRTGGEEMLVMRPLRLSSPPLLLRWKGTPSPTQKQWITRTGFYAAKFWHPQKRKPRRPYIEALSAVALLHSPGGRGGRPHHMQATTPPPDADSVSLSGKICGSPRSALCYTGALLVSAVKTKGPGDRPGPSTHMLIPCCNQPSPKGRSTQRCSFRHVAYLREKRVIIAAIRAFRKCPLLGE